MDVNKSSQQIIKENNIRLLFRLLHGGRAASRADLKKITGLSATTVSTLVEELIENGLVLEGGIKETKTSGRKAVAIKINPDGGYFLGLDIRKNRFIADIYCLDFSLLQHMEIPVGRGENFATKIMNVISRTVREKKILGISIGIPGVIDPETNRIISSTVLPVGDVNSIYEILSDSLPNIRVHLKNNSGLIALAEREFGGYSRINNLISIDIDDGVGAGILTDGVIYSGNGMAGEFGHVTVDYRGEKCTCGNYGCLELYASIPAILKKTGMASIDDLRLNVKCKDISEKISEIAKILAFGINNIVNLLNPEIIVICGEIKKLGDDFLLPLKGITQGIALIKDTKIEFSNLEGNAVTLGGAKYSFDELFGK